VTLFIQVHDGCQRFLKQHVIGAHPFFSAVETTLQGVIDLSRSVINSVYRRNRYDRPNRV
jgi:hypothetical protein